MTARAKVVSTVIPLGSHVRTGDEAPTVAIDYLKGTQFRTIHPDGAIGALTAQNRIELALFCERQAIPKRVVHKLEPDGTLGDVLETSGRNSVVREIDVVVSLSADVALTIAQFIVAQLDESRDKRAKKPISDVALGGKKASK